MAAPSKRPVRRIPRDDSDDDGEVPARRSVEDDPGVKKARQRLRDATPVEDDDEDDEPPTPKKTGAKAPSSGADQIRGGWTDAQRQMDSTSSFAQSLKLEEKAVVIKFLEDTSYANFRRHWVDRTTKDGKTTRAYTCLQTVGKNCPLCEIGDRAQAVAAFNVALIGDDGQVLIKSWDVGPRLYNVLKGYANDPKIGPLSRGYFLVSKTGKKGTVQHNVSSVSRTALRDDYDIEPPEQYELDALTKYTPEIVEIPLPKDIRELAEELAAEYDD
jgi:hypothetical protein